MLGNWRRDRRCCADTCKALQAAGMPSMHTAASCQLQHELCCASILSCPHELSACSSTMRASPVDARLVEGDGGGAVLGGRLDLHQRQTSLKHGCGLGQGRREEAAQAQMGRGGRLQLGADGRRAAFATVGVCKCRQQGTTLSATPFKSFLTPCGSTDPGC